MSSINTPRGPQYDERLHESWVGIPPMYHETWLAHGTRDRYVRGWTGRRMTCSTFYPGDDSRILLERSWGQSPQHERDPYGSLRGKQGNAQVETVRQRLDANQKSRKMMPPHLLPFVPYIEQSVDSEAGLRKRGTRRLPWIDTIRGWLDACEKVHGARCGRFGNTTHGSWSGPLWLIDVTNGCLVAAPADAEYIALSYVWGTERTSSCTTKANLDRLRQENGLYDCEEPLARVVTDAIRLVHELGKRHLWIDRFCIVQDDGIAKQCQLNAMGSIYANACFTLVAAQHENASDGLFGDHSEESSLIQSDPLKTFNDLTDSEVLLDQAMHLLRSKWYSRGWTFQEYLLSTRRVVFHNNTVNWECLCASWHERQDMTTVLDMQAPQSTGTDACICSHTPRKGFLFESLPWPNMFRYARLVSMFNRHDFTFPEDIFDAFAGILTHLSRSFPGGFISGLPQMCFDAALLWQPWTTMKRRKSIRRSAVDAVLPSWSWGGWEGNMNSESWRSASNYLFESDDEANQGQHCSWKTISTVKWSYSISLDSKRKPVRIPLEFANTQPENTTSQALPPGWTKRPPTGDHGFASYHHSSDPSHPFRFPIPIRDQYKAHIPPVTARFLHGTTRHGYLALGSSYRSIASDCPARDLVTENGEWAGAIRLDRTNYNGTTESNDTQPSAGAIELIEISAGEVRDQAIEEKSFDEWNRPDCPRRSGKYEFVNVLWVEWEEGVAYRKALGRVEKSMWEKVGTETIDVTIG